MMKVRKFQSLVKNIRYCNTLDIDISLEEHKYLRFHWKHILDYMKVLFAFHWRKNGNFDSENRNRRRIHRDCTLSDIVSECNWVSKLDCGQRHLDMHTSVDSRNCIHCRLFHCRISNSANLKLLARVILLININYQLTWILSPCLQ